MGRLGTPMVAGWVGAALTAMAAYPVAQGGAAQPGRYRTHVATDGPTFWVYTIDTTTGRVWFLDRQPDGAWEWVDDGPAPKGPGPIGKYRLVAFANDKGAHVYVCDTTTGELWRIDEQSTEWLPRGFPVPRSRGEAGERPGTGEAAQPSRFSTQVVTHGPTFWVYTIDTTTGRVWFLDREHDETWEWTDDGAAPNGPGPVGRYRLAAFANDKGAHLYVSDTTTGELWLIDEQNLQWLARGAPSAEEP